jgi:hypothetical protein
MSKENEINESFGEIIRPLCYVLGGLGLILVNIDKVEYLLFYQYNISEIYNF